MRASRDSRMAAPSTGLATESLKRNKPVTANFNGFLFDLDGTLIDSTAAIARHWHKLAADLNVNPETIIQSSRGRRSIDTIDVNKIEAAIPSAFGHDSKPVPGATLLLQQLNDSHVPWAMVTSCTRALLRAWVAKLALPSPEQTVTAEDVAAGKPDPACYRLAKGNLGLSAEAPTLVFEDSPTGVRAGKAAGCMVLAVSTTTALEKLLEAGADWVVRDLESVTLGRKTRGGWKVHFRDILGRQE